MFLDTDEPKNMNVLSLRLAANWVSVRPLVMAWP